MERFTEPAVDDYVHDFAAQQHHDQVLVEMEARADDEGFPIVGRAVGRTLELLARAIGARRVLELGSGFGYSAYWFAGAVGAGGEVICTERSKELAASGERWLRRAGRWDPVRYRIGGALDAFDDLDGEFDVIFNDIDKPAYPQAWERACERLRVGGLYLCDNTLWRGQVADPAVTDEATTAVRAHNRAVVEDDRFVSSLVPLRDGLLAALRVA